MSAERTVLVGGLSTVHDALLAAALRGVGRRAEALHPRTDAGLRRARALGNHGQCNPAHYAVGAVLEHARRSGLEPSVFAAQNTWLTVGSCGPCRLSAFGFEYARVLGGAGLEELPVAFVDQLTLVDGPLREGPGSSLSRLTAKEADALLLAIVAADVLTLLGHGLRPYALEPAAVDEIVTRATWEVAEALERRAPLLDAIARAKSRADATERDPTRVLPRVLLVGEPWTTLADGDPSYDLVRRLGAFGVEVETPTATDWLRYRIWDAVRLEYRGDATARPRLRRLVDATMLGALSRADRRIVLTWRWLARAAGLGAVGVSDMNELADLARPHYDPDVRGGSAHLEVGRARKAARDHTAHLVLSLKPFGCLPSSSLSDGVLSVLFRRGIGGPRFLALETTGDAAAAAESRIEMAVHNATLTAAQEFTTACDDCGISRSEALAILDARVHAPFPAGPRTYACTAAERVRREALRARTP